MEYKNYALLFLFLIFPFVSEINKRANFLPHSLTEFPDNSSLSLAVIHSKRSYLDSIALGDPVGHNIREIKRVKRDNDHDRERRAIKLITPGADWSTVCVSTQYVDECIDNTDPQVVERCVPGLTSVLGDEDPNKIGLITRQTNETEICLRQAFGHCSFDSRYRIKTKIKTITGVNVDLCFQDQFQMDCCDEKSMNEVLDTVTDCYKNRPFDLDINKCEDPSGDILEQVGYCVEDHTGYPCIMQNQTLFRVTTDRVIRLLTEQALKMLGEINSIKANATRLCFMWMDSTRLQPCESNFFDYVGELDNGIRNPPSFEGLFECYKDNLKVCPEKAIRILIKILIGAVDGKSYDDKELPPQEKIIDYEISVPKKMFEDSCSPPAVTSWISIIKICAQRQNSGDSDFPFKIVWKCIKKHPAPCRFHSFSQFKDVANGIIKIIVDIRPAVSGNCLDQIKNAENLDCLTKFFLYYVTLHHNHHTKESLNEQLEKLKLCYQILWKSCPFKIVIGILRSLGQIFYIIFPPLQPPETVTKITLPDGFLWCSTIRKTDEIQATTEMISRKPPIRVVTHKVTKTTIKEHKRTPKRERVTEKHPRPRTEIVTQRPETKIVVVTMTPTTVKGVTRPIKPKTQIVTFPAPRTKILTFRPTKMPWTKIITVTTTVQKQRTIPEKIITHHVQTPRVQVITKAPRPRTEIIEKVTPTTIKQKVITPKEITRRVKEKTPPVRIVTFAPKTRIVTFRITPTTIRRRIFTPKPRTKAGGYILPTKIITWFVYPKTRIQTMPAPTTVRHDVQVPTKEKIVTKPPVTPKIVTFRPKEKIITMFMRPTTARTRIVPVPPVTERISKKGTAVTRFIIHPTPRFETRKLTAATKTTMLRPWPTWYTKVIFPTTRVVRIITPKWKHKIQTRPPHVPKEFTMQPKPRTLERIIRPTTIRTVSRTFRIPDSIKTRQTVPVWTQIIYPPTKSYKGFKTRSTVKYVSLLPRTKKMYVTLKPTTIREKERRPKARIMTKEMGYKTYVFTMKPQPREHTFKKPKTTIRYHTFRPPVTRVWRTRIPRTWIVTFPPPPREIEFKVTPSTHKEHYITPKLGVLPKARPTSPRKLITYYPFPRTHYFVITPTTVKTRRFPIPPRIHTHEMKLTTLKYEKHIPKERIMIETAEMPTTKVRRFYKPEEHRWKIRPSTVKKIVITPPPVTRGIIRRPPPTKIITRIRTSVISRLITPTTAKECVYPFRPKIYTRRFEVVPTRKSVYTPKSRKFDFRIKPTTVKYMSKRPKTKKMQDKKTPTTVRIVIIGNREKEITKVLPVPSVKEFTFPRPPAQYTEILRPKPTRIITFRPITVTKKLIRIPKTKIITQPAPTKVIHEKKRSPTTRIIYTRPVTSKPRTKIIKEVPTRVLIFTPKDKHMEQRKTKTTVKLFTWPVKPEIQEITQVPTTRVIKKFPVKPETVVREMTVPATQPEEFPNQPKVYTQEIIPTTIAREIITLAPKTREEIIPVQTREIIWTPREKIVTKKIAPTTVKDFAFLLSSKYRISRKPIMPKVIVQKPSSAIYTRIIRPTVTSVAKRTPKDRIYTDVYQRPSTRIKRITIPHHVQTDKGRVVTEIVVKTPKAFEYECVYKPTVPVEICITFQRRCVPGVVEIWKKKIQDCILFEVQKDGKDIREVIQNYKEIMHYILLCIKKIGDTHCRPKKIRFFESILEREVEIAGSYNEQSPDSGEEHDDYDLKECVIHIDEAKMETCLPGLYITISGYVLYGKPWIEIESETRVSGECLRESIGKCDAKKELEAIIWRIIGKCIRIAPPKETSCTEKKLQHWTAKPNEHEECSSAEIYIIIMGIQNCPKIPGGVEDIDKTISITGHCTQRLPCRIRTWHAVEKLYDSHVKYIREFSGSNKCTDQLDSGDVKLCLRHLVELARTLWEVEDQESALKPIVSCVRSALSVCKPKVAEKIVRLVLEDIGESPVDVPDSGESYFHTTISSVKHHSSSISLCQNVHRSPAPLPDDRPPLSDDCIPVCNADGRGISLLVKTCTADEPPQWLKIIKNCVEEKTSKIGLRNPDYLRLFRVLLITKLCISKNPLPCRLKHRRDFIEVIKGLLVIVKQNTLSINKGEREKLDIEPFNPCMNQLHQFLVFTSDGDLFAKNREKALRCLRGCSKLTGVLLENFVDLLELSMKVQCHKIEQYKKMFEVCGSDDASEEEGGGGDHPGVIDLSEDVAPLDGSQSLQCGPGGYLRRVEKRDVHDISPTESYRDVTLEDYKQYGNHEKLKYFFQSTESSAGSLTEPQVIKQCNPSDYEKYGKELKICVKKRLQLKFRRMKNKCYWKDISETMAAMMECLIESDVAILSCKISTKEQLNKFLYHISKALKMDDVVTSGPCFFKQSCQNISLDVCSSAFYNLLKTGENNSLVKILHGFYAVNECFDSKWPRCPSNFSTLSASILLSALGIDYDLSVVKSAEFISCTVQGPLEDERILRACLSDHTYDNPFAICQNCANKRAGICSYENVEALYEVVTEDTQRVSRCLKTFKLKEECINDFAVTLRDNCLPMYYRFLEHVHHGRVVGIIEKLREFHQCITDTKSGCPEEFKYFVPEVYLDILGINQFMEKNLKELL